MEESENQEAYDNLINILKNNGLEWVTIQVAEYIRNGKTIQKEIDTFKEGQTMYLLDEPQHSFRTGNIYEFKRLLI
jgi:hypothetical protein